MAAHARIVAAWTAILVCSCVPGRGTSRKLVALAHHQLRQDDPVAASKTLDRADQNLERDPDPQSIEVIEGLRLRIESRLIEKAIDYYGARTGDHLEAVARLHELRKRVLMVKADPGLRDRAARHLNQRASFAIEAVERAPAVPDLAALLDLGKYPELEQDNRDRLELQLKRARAAHEARAAAAKTPVLARLHLGIAAIYGAPRPPMFDPASVPDIFAVERATSIRASVAAGCDQVESALRSLERNGGYRVDAEVAITRCAHATRIQKRTESYTVSVTKSRVVEKTYTETVCTTSNERVTKCDSSNCVVTKYWGEQSCSPAERTAQVLEYYQEDEQRQREVADTIHTLTVDGTALLTVDGTRGTPQPWSITNEASSRITADGPVTVKLRELLDTPIRLKRATAAAAHAAASEAAMARGTAETAETESAIALLLGHEGESILSRTYPLSIAQLRSAFGTAPPALAIMATAPEEVVEPLASRLDYGWLSQTEQALLEPAVGRTRGLNYQTQLGALHASEVTASGTAAAGEWAPALELRLGTPLLGRLKPLHALPIGIYDDAALSGYLGYKVAGADSAANKYTFAGGAHYAVTLGLRTRLFSIYGGARVSTLIAKIAGTSGRGFGVPWYGQLVFRTGPVAVALEAWLPSGVGDRARGGTVMAVSRGKRKDGHNGMFGLRFEQLDLDGCADTDAGMCVDVEAVPVAMYSLILGVGF